MLGGGTGSVSPIARVAAALPGLRRDSIRPLRGEESRSMAERARAGSRPEPQHEDELREEIEAAMAPPRSHARFPLFDSLRGLAAISILFVHVGIFTNAFG